MRRNEDLIVIPPSKNPTPYDGFNICHLIDYLRLLQLKKPDSSDDELRFLKIFIPLEWRKDGSRWFSATEISKCLRWAGFTALGEKGLPTTLGEQRKMEKGRLDHYRLEREFNVVALAKEISIFDPENFVYGKCDLLARNFITGELFVVDFKTIDNWSFHSRLKRKGLIEHLRKTPFYPALPDDEIQIMLYIRMWRKLIRHPEIPIRFGMVIYENKNNPNERKSALVEYDEALMKKFFAKLAELNQALDNGKNIEPYIPPDDYVHSICPFRLKCPLGQQAMKKKLKRRNIPFWKILELKRRARQAVPPAPEVNRQLALF